MLIPLMGFTFSVMVFGGLLRLVAIADPYRQPMAFIAFPLFYAGLGAILLSFGLTYIVDNVLNWQGIEGITFFFGYLAGGIAGSIAGLSIALRRSRRMSSKE